MTTPNVSITTFLGLGDLSVANVTGAVNFQFQIHQLQGRLLEDFLRDFDIHPQRWCQPITMHQTFVVPAQLAKWQKQFSRM